ncbi:facilitated trehalose transporter Tret1 isoform X1 [Bemisia tabaci]|uniref:facilitated trehalose transporter Tret1 isoform X1 n=1 Tax=Bemisia tabaci TaxID=7038 RepID=UPI003B286527
MEPPNSKSPGTCFTVSVQLEVCAASSTSANRAAEKNGAVTSDHTWRDGFYQGFVSLVALSMLIHPGVGMGFSTILHPQIKHLVSDEQNSWIASLVAFGTPVGALSSGPLMDKFGRRSTCILTCGVAIASWSALVFMPPEFSLLLLYIARILSGVAGGLTSAGVVYVSEVTNKYWRSVFLGLASVLLSTGVLLVTSVGYWMHWKSFSVFCLAIAVLNLLLLLTIPESPHWLIRTRPEKAKRALMRLNKNIESFEEEWQSLDEQFRKKQKAQMEGTPRPSLSSRQVYVPFLIMGVTFTMQQLCGVYPIIFYALEVFQAITGDSGEIPSANSTDPSTETTTLASLIGNSTLMATDGSRQDLKVKSLIGVGLIRFVMSILAVSLSRTIGRRPLLLSSCAGSAISGFAFSLYFFGCFGQEVNDLVSMSLVLVFLLFSSYGLLVIPWAQIGELIPSSHRAKGGSYLISYAYFLMFLVVKVFPFTMETFGVGGLFMFFSIILTLEGFFVYFYMPETLGKTFLEIEKYFATGVDSDGKGARSKWPIDKV